MQRFIAVFMTLTLSLLVSLGFVSRNTDAWALELPVYEGGQISENLYIDGSGMKRDDDGPIGLESLMELVRYTNQAQYDSYCAALKEAGYQTVYENTLGGVTCTAFRQEEKLYYTYYAKRKNEVRIIEDNNTLNFEDFGYEYGSGEGVTVYQFDYPYYDEVEKNDEALYADNGMMYIIHLSDNSLIIVDGGAIRQSSDQNIDECIKFLHKITGTEAGEPIRIALWYGTHGHSDHLTFFYKLLGHYHNELLLERVMFNYPSFWMVEQAERINMFRKRLGQLYPEVKYLCPHTGMSFPMANVTIDVLYTQEDAVSAKTGETPIVNPNDGSTVCRITAAGKRLLITGDMNHIAEDELFAIHGPGELKTDVLQAAHHLYNKLPRLYMFTGADYVFCPQSEGCGKTLRGYKAARPFYKDEQLLFADNALYGIAMNADGLTLSVDHTDCGSYDDSSMNKIR